MGPERCSIMTKGRICTLPPSHIVSILSNNEEYMIGLVCSDHILLMKSKTVSMQKSGKIDNGEFGRIRDGKNKISKNKTSHDRLFT